MAGNSKIIVLSEQLRGQSFELTEPKYTIGRHEDCHICIPDPTVSNHHCTLVRMDDMSGYVARDEGSTNGTRVNGVRLQQDQEQRLVNSDILQVGAIEMLYDSEDKDEPAAASTRTGINLQNTAGTTTISEIPNFSPFGSPSRSRRAHNGAGSLLTKVVVTLIALAVLAILGFLLFKLLHL